MIIEDPNSKPWRDAVGGMWDEIGNLQFEFLIEEGLLPKHKFLDVGCGSLRGGIHFIAYLEEGNYYGIDQNKNLLDAGLNQELPLLGLSNHKAHIYHNADFDFSHFSATFDFVLAQSVFTHLAPEAIVKCLTEIEKVLAPDGKFYVTFFEIKSEHASSESKVHHPGGTETYSDRDPFHYKFEELRDLGREANLISTYVGDWHHPRNQMMLYYHKK